ncbi:MAG: Asp23/Gls24 family envelope stress response protein [Moorellaceae bacterium]
MPGGIAGSIASALGRKDPARGVRVEAGEVGLRLVLTVEAVYGTRIPEAAARVQEAVKVAVEEAKGVRVAAVDRGFRPGCSCPGNDGSGRCVVLDPFGGSGMTTLVAASLDRDSIYIDLKREYAEMALERCGFGQDMFGLSSWELMEIGNSQQHPESWDRGECSA